MNVNPTTAKAVSDLTGWMYAGLAIVYGTSIIVGGEDRWAAPAYKTALTVPGAPATWGAVFLTFGVILLVGVITGRTTPIRVGAGLCALWCMFFAVTFLVETIRNDAVGYGGPILWGWFAVMYLIRMVSNRPEFA